jgi:hypothetical protein
MLFCAQAGIVANLSRTRVKYRGGGLLDAFGCGGKIRGSKKQMGRRVMVAVVSGDLPHRNPCAQCGEPIAAPSWFEDGPHCVAYLWQCSACGYKFEALAVFAEAERRRDPLAA